MQTSTLLSAVLLGSITIVASAVADPMVYETFSDYPDNALISKGPAGFAVGLVGDWSLDAENFFY
ncbi:MAG: hypothetical protein KJO72_08800, partial [Gammaproteobacteria bacterium]|nr:hypothetical protein [Gammaproteobacteria bacterium]